MKNPYITHNPVGNQTTFIGRENILNTILDVVKSADQNAMVLYGQRRIGKTSVLQALETQLLKEYSYHIVNFSLEGKDSLPLKHLLRDLAQYISGVVQPKLEASHDIEEDFKQWFVTWFEQLPREKTLVLLIDEFDSVLKSKIAKKFFPYLRELLVKHQSHLNCIFVIGRDVEDLSSDALSQFQTIPTQKISLLSQDETQQLITLSDSEMNQSLKWSDEAVSKVKQLTNGHPFFTQLLCFQIWQLVYEHQSNQPELPTVTGRQVEQAIPKTLAADFNNWEYVWNGLPPAGKVIASALAETGKEANFETLLDHIFSKESIAIIMRELREVPERLQDWDLIEPVAENTYRFRVELVRRWIQNYKPLDDVQIELDRLEPAADTLYQTGKKLYEDKHQEQAILTLRQAISAHPSHIEANKLLADILAQQRKLNEAYEVLDAFSKYSPRAAKPQLVTVLLALAEKSERNSEKLKYCHRILEIEPAHSEANKLKREIEWQREAKRWKPAKLAKQFVATYRKRIYQAMALIGCLVFSYWIAEDLPSIILLEIEQSDNSQYSLIGVPSSKNYALESMHIIVLDDIAPQEPPSFEYQRYKSIKLEIVSHTKTPAYQVNTELLQNQLQQQIVFQYPYSKPDKLGSFTFDIQFPKDSPSKIDFACQATTTKQERVDCKVKQKGYFSLLRGIPWWGMSLLLFMILFVIIEIVFAFKNREPDDVL